MGNYLDGVKRRWKGMVDGDWDAVMDGDPSTGGTHQGYQATPAAPQPAMIRQKFRDIFGRDPYSDQELRDWWNSF